MTMKKINYKLILDDSELITLIVLLACILKLYSLTHGWGYLVAFVVWSIHTHITLSNLSRLAVGGAVKESTDE